MFELTILAMGSERHGAVDLSDEQGSNGNPLTVLDGPEVMVVIRMSMDLFPVPHGK